MAKYGPVSVGKLPSSKLVLRHCTSDDAALFHAFQSKVSAETTHTLQIASLAPSIEKVKTNWDETARDVVGLRLGVFDENKLVGQLGLHPLHAGHPWVSHIGQFGMMVLKEYWGQGIGRSLIEAMHEHAKQVGLRRIEAFVRTNNPRGVHLYLRNGYKIEGVRRRAALIDGSFRDEFYIANQLDDPHTIRPLPILKTQRLLIEPLFNQNPSSIVDYFRKNADHFAKTDPAKPDGFYSEDYWEGKITQALSEYFSDSAVRLVIKDPESCRIMGTINFTQIFRGPFQACYLGFGIESQSEGQGLMKESLESAIEFMFTEFNIHRIMANHLLSNTRSSKTLGSLGFQEEGQAKDYLLIADHWQDHVLTSKTNVTFNSIS